MAHEKDAHREVLLSHLNRLLSAREYPKTICPSEVPRALTATEMKTLDVSDWRDLMPDVRELLWDLRRRGQVQILQKGALVPNDVDLRDISGPIRARRIPC